MNPDPASLANLRDIVEPPPVPWWPLAPGWWLLLMMVGLIVALVAIRQYRCWRANAYRRAALRELEGIDQLSAIAEILKRVALVAYPRAQVASLTGTAWVNWLAETGGRPVPSTVSQALEVGAYTQHARTDVRELVTFAGEWVRSHKTGANADMKG